MEPRIKQRFQPDILQAAMQRFGIGPGTLTLLGDFNNYVYPFNKGSDPYILRIAHSLLRSVSLIQAEVDWINYLAEGGAGVARAVLSESGSLVESIPDGLGEQFLAVAFVKAPGHPPGDAEWTPSFIETYGRLLGRIHALSQKYQPSHLDCLRPQWDDPNYINVERFLPPSEQGVLARFHELMRRLRSLPRDRQSYGLIHQDAHGGNFFVDDHGQITLFDFDGCCYAHFIYDIAVVFFNGSTMRPEDLDFFSQFAAHFLHGYSQENHLDRAWLAEIPAFLKLREIDLYSYFLYALDLENSDDEWAIRFMQGRKERIEAGIPFLDIDFRQFA